MPLAAQRDGSSLTPRRGRPRDPKVDEAIMAATLELLAEEGYSRLTIESVAQRAGVARTSLYRRWSTKDSLVLDSVVKVGLATWPDTPDTGSLREDMLSYLSAWIRFRRAQAWSSEILANPELKEVLGRRVGVGLTSGFRTILERAVDRGELGSSADVDLLATLPMGLIHQRFVLIGKQADEALARRIVDQFFDPSTVRA